MRNDFFLPPGSPRLTADCLAGLPLNAITQACRENVFRRLVRWRGLAPYDTETFTARIDARPGVFGMRQGRAATLGTPGQADEQIQMRFELHYFPAPEEDLCERLRLVAAVETQRPGYADAVRSFPLFPELAGPFLVAQISLAAPPDASALALSLEAPERKRIRSLRGIPLPGSEDWLVPPGDLEEDIPALDIARAWFDVFGRGHNGLRRRTAEHVPPRAPPGLGGAAGQKRPLAECRRAGIEQCFRLAVLGGMPPQAKGEVALELRGADLKPEALPKEAAQAPCWRVHTPSEEDALPAFDADRRPSLFVLCGFLGSGKTTLLNGIIERQRARERCVGVIQNEIGATGVDERLVGDAAPVLAMDEGCVCCTISGNLRAGVRELQARANPEVLILETTGLANPLNLRAELEELREMVRLEAVIAVLDGLHGEALLAESELGRDQVRGADVVVLSKCNLASPGQRLHLRAEAKALNPAARLYESSIDPLPPELLPLFEPARTAAGLLPRVPGAHTSHGDEGFSAVRLYLRRPLPRADIVRLARTCPGDPFRVKGILETLEDGPVLLQGVGKECAVEPFAGSGKTSTAPAFIVCIGRHLDSRALLAHWAEADAAAELPPED